jgi:hypothetical protein
MDESGIEVESPNATDSSVARGNEALTVLDNPRTKNEFIAQLMEVRFLLRSFTLVKYIALTSVPFQFSSCNRFYE